MKERPILFQGAMVRAILDGTKTQTRRICKPAEAQALSFVCEVPDPKERGQVYNGSHFGNEDGGVQFASPYGGRGDRLWVREAWQAVDGNERARRIVTDPNPSRGWIEYAATVPEGHEPPPHWRPSIHMPRWASRINLEVTDVRVERLQDISEADAIAEGVKNSLHLPGGRFATENYEHLWWTMHGDEAWEANPWVWVVEFRRLP